MRIDLTCPAEILSTTLPTAEEPWISLLLMNGTDRGINSCEATVKVLDSRGQELGRAVHRARALAGRPHMAFRMTVPMEPMEGATAADARLDKIWFEDNDVWRRNEAAEVEYEENILPPGNDLNALRYVAGPTAVGFPSQQARLWVCVCGRANGNKAVFCARCRRRKETIFQQYNRDAVLRQVSQREHQLELKTRGAREEAARIQREREAEYDRLQFRKARRRRLGAALAAAALLIAGVVFGIEPAMRLLSADRAIGAGRLEQAEETLLSLGGFPGAQERLERSRLLAARRDGAAAVQGTAEPDAEALELVSARLRDETAEEADTLLADRVDLKRAELLLAKGNTEDAEKLLLSLPEDTEGRAALMTECTYRQGLAEMAGKRYDAARKIFLALGDYQDAEKKAQDCLYEPALALMEAGDYDGALASLEQIPDYLDSGELIRKCWYLRGITLENAGETEAARQAYLQAGSYEDAADRALALRRIQADAEMAVQNYAEAMAIYRELDGEGDAREKWILCATEMARAAYKVRDYELAAETLTGLPEDTKETLNIRTRALYLGAKAAAEAGDLEKAIGMMDRVSTYSDAQRNLRKWRMTLAEEKMEAEAWAEAKALLEPISEYYSAQRLLKQVEKKLTEAAAQETVPPDSAAEDGEGALPREEDGGTADGRTRTAEDSPAEAQGEE